jgi:hypothetical protein
VVEKTVARKAAGFFIELLKMQIGTVAKRRHEGDPSAETLPVTPPQE